MSEALLAALRACIGDAHVLAGDGLEAYELDWRRRFRGRSLAVARPANTDEVAQVVRLCAARQVPIVPQGGNTGLVGGGVPDASGRQLLLSLGRLRRVRAIDADDLSATVEAGCTLQAVQEAAESRGLLFPLALGSQGSCTIGGNLATNAGGTQVLRYGNARALCLGLEVVTAAGEVWNGLSTLRKDNSGYDLRDLFIGSEGTLGIITAATLALHPRPRDTATALVACARIEDAIALLRLARARLDAGLAGFELMHRDALRLVARHVPGLRQPFADATWSVLLELGAPDGQEAGPRLQAALAEAAAGGIAADAVLATGVAQSRALWQLRESIPAAQAREGANAKHDIALPVSAIPGFLREMAAQLPALVPGLRPVVFGHLGDGNLHFNLQAPEGMPPREFLRLHEAALNRCVFDAVERLGGSFAAEHGIGALRASELARRKPAVALAMMRAIKQALDPHGLLNPGRVLGDRDPV